MSHLVPEEIKMVKDALQADPTFAASVLGMAAQRKTAQTNATGDYTWVFNTPFTAIPVIPTPGVMPAAGVTNPHDCNIVSVSTTQAVFKVARARTFTPVLSVLITPWENAGVVTLNLVAWPAT